MHDDQLDTCGEFGGGYSSLSQEEPVFTAGKFFVKDGQIVCYNRISGHYWPRDYKGYMPIKDVTSEAFHANGYPAAPDAVWDP